MKHIKKILAVAMVVVMAITALTFSANSESIADTAKNITSGQSVTAILNDYADTADYKINVMQSGTLKISLTAEMHDCYVYVYDSNGNKLNVTSHTITSSSYKENQKGDDSFYAQWNSTIEQFAGTISYAVNKGTYYIRVYRSCDHYSLTRSTYYGDGDVKLTATFPSSSTSTSKGKVYYLRLTMDKGDTLGIGAVVSSGTKVTWTTSNSNVATVKNGKVTAKAKGSAIITAKCGTSSQKIKIVVQ